MEKTVKCVVVGDGDVGKTSLLFRFVKKEFPNEYHSTVFENYAATIPPDVILHLFDTAGQEDYSNIRKMTYTGAKVFVVCFSVNNHASYYNVRDHWVPELREKSKAPILLVGTKVDLRDDEETITNLRAEGKRPITKVEGETLAQEINAAMYIECSAKEMINVETVFLTANSIATNVNSENQSCQPCQPLISICHRIMCWKRSK